MTRRPDERLAVRTAEYERVESGLNSPPIDPMVLARKEEVVVEASDKLEGAFSGCLMRQGQKFLIVYSTSVNNTGFRRFTIAHELGHYFLTNQHSTIFDVQGLHKSESGYSSSAWYEREADVFATALLLPESMFVEQLRGQALGLVTVKRLAEVFETSLISTAIRYAQLAPDPVAVVVSRGQLIEYCFTSESLQRVSNVRWSLKKGDLIPKLSATAGFNKSLSSIEAGLTAEDKVHLGSWFSESAVDFELNEDVIGLGSYGRTLTILHAETIPDDDGAQSATDDRFTHSSKPAFDVGRNPMSRNIEDEIAGGFSQKNRSTSIAQTGSSSSKTGRAVRRLPPA